MSGTLSFLSNVALVCAVIALWKPWIYPRKPISRIKSVLFYLVLFVILFLLAGLFGPDAPDTTGTTGTPEKSSTSSENTAVATDSLSWTLLNSQRVAMPGNGRDRLLATVVLTGAKGQADQQTLQALATRAAEQLQQESGVPVLVLHLISQRADRSLAEGQLAQVVYIPDGKGFDGAASPRWETLRVAKRSFSEQELRYLHLWAERQGMYQTATGVDAKALDAAVSKETGVAPGSLQPFGNTLEAVRPSAE